jgi:uncharacterized membrane protein (UPF0136 family)
MKFLSFYSVTICVSVLAACLLGWSGLSVSVALSALGLGVAIGLFAASKVDGSRHDGEDPARRQPVGPWESVALIIFALFALRCFCWVIFHVGDSIHVLCPNNLGDASIHLTYIRYLASGVGFWPDNPIFAAGKLHYPLGTDLFNSLLLLAGVPADRGLVWMGLLGSLAAALALWLWGRAFAISGFLFNGGLAGLALFGLLPQSALGPEIAWKSIPLTMFVTQRGLLYAIPVGLLLLAAWRARFFENRRLIPLWMEVLLYSTLPLFHFHTFLFLSLLLGIWFLAGVSRAELFKLVACSVVPATILVGLVVGFSGNKSLIHFQPGWMQGKQNFFVFWGVNFGILPVLVGWLCWVVARGRNRDGLYGRNGLDGPQLRGGRFHYAGYFVLPAVGVFLLSCFVMFAPWAWDNIKLMVWCYLTILPFLWSHLIAPRSFPVRALVCGLLFFSGLLSLLEGMDRENTGHEIALRSEVDSLGLAVRDLPKAAVFAGCPTWNHPLLFNGRKLALGYPGHLWSYGIDYLGSMERLDELMNGEPGWEKAARDLNIRYIFWGPLEEGKWPESKQPWKNQAACVALDSWGAIYDLASIETLKP